ncbi:MAG: hypothetical protein ACP5KG_03630 [Myxococcota bacterium]
MNKKRRKKKLIPFRIEPMKKPSRASEAGKAKRGMIERGQREN